MSGRSSMWIMRRVVGATLALFIASCGVSEPLEDVRVGVLREVDGEPAVVVPPSARAGEPFDVLITTVGGGCIREGETEVVLDGDVPTVTAYDRYAVPRPGIGCLGVEAWIEHTASVSFASPGDAVVVVRGRDGDTDQITELTYPIRID
jgi:hypothetical protein